MPSMSRTRTLIVTADDFGLSPGVNRGVIRAYERGIVTGASLMVRAAAAQEAAAYGREHPELAVGLHIDLGEWIYRGGEWVASYEVVPPEDRGEVGREVARQLDRFRRLVGRDPTHLDSHQHVHLREPARSVAVEVARGLAVPLRRCTRGIAYCGAFYGRTRTGEPLEGAIGVPSLLATLDVLPPGPTELVCHPGLIDHRDDVYGCERAEELETLCDPRVRSAILASGIELRSFRDLAGKEGWHFD